MGRILGSSIVLAVFVSSLGLFSLSSFAVERRRKEIGMRKALGASVSGIVGMLLRDFVLLVLAAGLVACPLSYAVMSRWLARFAYRSSL